LSHDISCKPRLENFSASVQQTIRISIRRRHVSRVERNKYN
jgi:hypothetical protein